MNGTQRALAALLLSQCVWLSACTSLAPWERGHLAKAHMALQPYPAESQLREHAHRGREASSGGGSSSGGGCGCY